MVAPREETNGGRLFDDPAARALDEFPDTLCSLHARRMTIEPMYLFLLTK